MQKRTAVIVLLPLLALTLAGCSMKGASDKNQGNVQGSEQVRGQGKGLPSEALSACQDKSEGDSCEMTMPKRENSENSGANQMEGVCKKMHDDQLACMPDMSNMPEGEGPVGPGGPNGPNAERPV